MPELLVLPLPELPLAPELLPLPGPEPLLELPPLLDALPPDPERPLDPPPPPEPLAPLLDALPVLEDEVEPPLPEAVPFSLMPPAASAVSETAPTLPPQPDRVSAAKSVAAGTTPRRTATRMLMRKRSSDLCSRRR
jgi:hypothetical protein